MTASMMGQIELAKTALRKAANSANDFEGKEEARRRLAWVEAGTPESAELSLGALEAMAKQQPNDVLLQIRLGEAYQKQGAFDKAAAAFEQALKVNPELSVATTKLAELYAGPLNNNEKALVYAKKARKLAPADPQTTILLGKIAYQNGNFGWSYSLLQEAARQRRDDPAVLYTLGWSAYATGKVNEAQDLMQKVAAGGGNSLEISDAKKFLRFTMLEQDPKQLVAAEAEVQNEVAANGDYVPALMAQAAVYSQRQPRQAIEIYNRVLRRFPDLALAQKRLAALYAQDEATSPQAYELAVKARKVLPDDPELAVLLARLSYARKEYARTAQLLEETARTKRLGPDLLFYLGMSQLQANQLNEARGVLNEALTNGLQEPFATEAKRALANLDRN
jgi:tetratricopeptide (TPR) repeat protein